MCSSLRASHDGTPNTLLEGMACGCFPIVEIWNLYENDCDGENGFLVDPSDPTLLRMRSFAPYGTRLRRRARALNAKIIRASSIWLSDAPSRGFLPKPVVALNAHIVTKFVCPSPSVIGILLPVPISPRNPDNHACAESPFSGKIPTVSHFGDGAMPLRIAGRRRGHHPLRGRQRSNRVGSSPPCHHRSIGERPAAHDGNMPRLRPTGLDDLALTYTANLQLRELRRGLEARGHCFNSRRL